MPIYQLALCICCDVSPSRLLLLHHAIASTRLPLHTPLMTGALELTNLLILLITQQNRAVRPTNSLHLINVLL